MRLPHIISKNTKVAYEASKETLNLIYENNRTLKPEDHDLWDKDHCPTLATYCVDVINKNFAKNPLLDELPCPDRDYLLETLSLDLSLELVVPKITDEIYWQRRFTQNYGNIKVRKPPKWTWKVLYLERFMQELLEQAEPQYNDEDDMQDMTKLCCPYVKRLNVTQLQAWKPPLNYDEEDIPEIYPTNHINFEPVFNHLKNVVEFSLIYGMNNVADKFEWHMFKLSELDCTRLGKAINLLKDLKILRVHRSKLQCGHARALAQGLVKNLTIEELDLSHCCIEDQGALCLAKVVKVHPKLKILNLTNNRIRKIGCEGLGFALMQPTCCPLEVLNLKLNPLGEDGAMGIWRCLVRVNKLRELSMAACQFDEEAPMKCGKLLILNESLEKIDFSNNWLDEEGGASLITGMTNNKTVKWLDLRETDITREQDYQIKKLLKRNLLGLDEVEESIVEEEQEPEPEIEPEEEPEKPEGEEDEEEEGRE